MKSAEEILKEYINFEDVNQSETLEILPLTIVDAMEEYATQCQEDMADKKYTEEDINEMACDFVINVGGLPKTIEEWQNALWKFYQSLNKQDNE